MKPVFKVLRMVRHPGRLKKWTCVTMVTGLIFFLYVTTTIIKLVVSDEDLQSLKSSAVFTSDSHECQVVHICVLCAGSAVLRDIVPMLQTLLFYRQTAVLFHFVTDKQGARTLTTLFETWQLPAVVSKVYPIPDAKDRTSGLEGVVLALTDLSNILPYKVEKVIIVDSHLRFLDSIHELWKQFDNFESHQMIGITQKPVYREEEGSVRYYVDVLLLDLVKLRGSKLSRETREADLAGWSDLHTFFYAHREYIYEVPCIWNVRLETDFPLFLCLNGQNGLSPKVLWWGKGADVFSKDGQLESYKEAVFNILTSNGDLLRQSQTICFTPANHIPQFNSGDMCSGFRYHATLKRRTHTSFISSDLPYVSNTPKDVSLLTQMSLDRFTTFERMAQNWEGPISVACHLTEEEADKLPNLVLQSRVLGKRKNIEYHVVYRRDKYYPINYMRNVAVSACQTPYSLFMDVDLVPMAGSYPYIKRVLSQYDTNKLALVVPAFEGFDNLTHFPANKSQFLEAWSANRLDGYKMSRKWNLGHKPTNYSAWKVSNEPYEVTYQDAFEPYMVLETKEMPKYNEKLLERMGDKIAYGLHVHSLGYRFVVLDDTFVIHLPHPVSDGHVMWQKNSVFQKCGAKLVKEFKDEMKFLLQQQRFYEAYGYKSKLRPA